jgi:peroxiredoxin
MNRALSLLTVLFVVASPPAWAGAPAVEPPSTPAGARGFEPVGNGPDYAVVESGSQAPDFAFEGAAGWRRLHELRAQGHVLLIFGARDAELVRLEHERGELLAIGVVPVAVVDRKAAACRALASRLRLEYALVPDPQRVIAAQYNALDPNSRSSAAAWFVLDREGRVHDLGRFHWPTQRWRELAASALGLAVAGGAAPASYPAR